VDDARGVPALTLDPSTLSPQPWNSQGVRSDLSGWFNDDATHESSTSAPWLSDTSNQLPALEEASAPAPCLNSAAINKLALSSSSPASTLRRSLSSSLCHSQGSLCIATTDAATAVNAHFVQSFRSKFPAKTGGAAPVVMGSRFRKGGVLQAATVTNATKA